MKFFILTMCSLIGLTSLLLVAPDLNVGQMIIVAITAILTFWGFMTLITSSVCHLDDLATVIQKKQEITFAEERLEAVKALAADNTGLPEQLLALSQEDNPVTKYMGLVTSSIKNVEVEKSRLARIEARIAVRAAGPLGIVVTWFGTGTAPTT